MDIFHGNSTLKRLVQRGVQEVEAQVVVSHREACENLQWSGQLSKKLGRSFRFSSDNLCGAGNPGRKMFLFLSKLKIRVRPRTFLWVMDDSPSATSLLTSVSL